MCIYVCHDAAAFLNLEEAQSYFLFFFWFNNADYT